MTKILKAVFCMAAVLGLMQVRAGQDARPVNNQEPTFKAGNEEVVLDVVVRDKKNRPLNNLTAGDFEIFDNGEKRAINSFRLVQGDEAVSSGGRIQLDPMRQIRLLTLVFDGLDNEGRRLSRDAGLSLVKNELQPNVYISVMAIDHALEAIQPFSNDRDVLKKAVERATGGSSNFASDTARVRAQLQQIIGPNTSGQGLEDQTNSLSTGGSGQSGPAAAPNGSAAANAAMAQMMLRMLQSKQQDESTDQGRAKIAALLQLVKEQYSLPGRKTILYFTPGFQIPQGMEEPFRSVISIANRSNVSFYALDARGLNVGTENASSNEQLRDAMSASAENMHRGNVSTGNAQAADMAIEAGRANVQNTLAILAESTGGFLIANTNDFTGKLKRLTEDIETYYEISYNPQIQSYDGAFRKISIRTDVTGARVQSRSGYFALPPAMRAQAVLSASEVPLLRALGSAPLPRAFGFETAAMHFKDANGKSTCVLVVDLPVGNLTLQLDKATNRYSAKFAYVVVVKDGQGQVLKKFHREIPLNIEASQVEAVRAASHFIDVQNFELAPGRYRLESAVLDTDGERISARKSVFVMPLANEDLAISSITPIRDMKPQGGTPASSPLVMSGQVVSPMVNPVVKKADSKGISFFVVVYPRKTSSDKPTLELQFSRDGQLIGGGSPPLGNPDAQGKIQYVATVPLAQLQAGDYQVRFVARQGAQSSDESVAFTVE